MVANALKPDDLTIREFPPPREVCNNQSEERYGQVSPGLNERRANTAPAARGLRIGFWGKVKQSRWGVAGWCGPLELL